MAKTSPELRKQRARIRAYVNENIRVQALLSQLFDLDVAEGQTFRCPMHIDERKSAKLYEDNAFWCFACQVQFTPYRVLRDQGYDLDQIAQHIPPEFMPDLSSEIERKEQLDALKLTAQQMRSDFMRHGDLSVINLAWISTFPPNNVDPSLQQTQ